MSSDDPFERLGEQQISAPRKAQLRAAERRQERKKEEHAIQFQRWQQWHRKRKAELLGGRFGDAAAALAGFVEHMSLADGNRLIALVEAGPWREADDDTRYLLLGMLDHAIMYLREANGLPPLDDALPWSDEEPTVFEIIRSILVPDWSSYAGEIRA